ncbi:hypothetical protein HGA11_15300 [Mycolicibacterium septicum DSM 44393]|uniref:Uncharacterized protein n=1 Tax=Mycolicibacterium septicum DSM 44393 TaxID=1341646 RepID=A0A7X6MP77_9MYCO|nr:hypothetical protein [Mycolicibacterium septicum]NKZ12345.1 hypothetical protein [Mycolicibacterium septicum DSM 44393]
MAKHRKMSERSVRTRTLVGGVIAGGALAVALPTGLASADSSASGNAVGRPAFDNPAPGVRAAQAVGDKVFNQTPGVNKTLDDSPLGEVYHTNFGTGNYADPSKGTNGVVQGELNVNAGKYYYNQTQKYSNQYLGNKILPDEKDLPGTLPKAIAGDGPTAKVSSAKPSNANKSLTCVAAASCNH